MAAKRTRELPTTAYAILGMLTFREMSGYDLGKTVSQSIAYFFSPAKSHIYAELRRLVSVGYASERKVRQQDRPDKRLYRATPKGERALREWLERPETEEESFRSPFTLKLFFGHHMSRETLIAKVKEYRRGLQAQLDEFKEIERRIGGSDELLYPYLTLRCGLSHVRAATRWADEVLAEVQTRGSR
jgi:DNA-binding PadR family transcriptional regulator